MYDYIIANGYYNNLRPEFYLLINPIHHQQSSIMMFHFIHKLLTK